VGKEQETSSDGKNGKEATFTFGDGTGESSAGLLTKQRGRKAKEGWASSKKARGMSKGGVTEVRIDQRYFAAGEKDEGGGAALVA